MLTGMTRSVKASSTSVELSLRSTRIISASLVNSSMTLSVHDQTWFGRSGHAAAKAVLSFAAFVALSALHVAKCAKVQQPDPSPCIFLEVVGQLDDIVGKTLFVGAALRDLALRGSVLAKCTAGAALGYAKLLAHVVDAFAAAKGSEVSPCSLSQNELVQRQVRHRPT